MSALNKKILLITLSFCVVLILTKVQFINSLDQDISSRIYNFLQNNSVTQIFLIITDYGIGIIFIIFSAYLLFKRSFYSSLFLLCSYLFQVLIVEVIKSIVQRGRPFTSVEGVEYLAKNIPIAFSFPSAHTSSIFFISYLFTNLIKVNKPIKFLIYFLAVLISFSRIYLGAHYLLDVIGGAILGIVLGMLAVKLSMKIKLP